MLVYGFTVDSLNNQSVESAGVKFVKGANLKSQ